MIRRTGKSVRLLAPLAATIALAGTGGCGDRGHRRCPPRTRARRTASTGSSRSRRPRCGRSGTRPRRATAAVMVRTLTAALHRDRVRRSPRDSDRDLRGDQRRRRAFDLRHLGGGQRQQRPGHPPPPLERLDVVGRPRRYDPAAVVGWPPSAHDRAQRRSPTLSGSDAWAVGKAQYADFSRNTLVEHWNGSAWSLVSGAHPGGQRARRGRRGRTSDVWAVGSGGSRRRARRRARWSCTGTASAGPPWRARTPTH